MSDTPIADRLFAEYADATADRTTVAAKMAEEIGRLERELKVRGDVARSQWIACKDQMPNNRGAATNVYLCWFQGRYAALEFDSQCGWCWGSGDMMLQRDQADVTHWQPLPDSPA